MPHIHPLYDFVVSVFIVCGGRVLLIDHKKYDEWLPIGGHIELDEDPKEALYREIQEECGLPVRILSRAPAIGHPDVRPLPSPHFMDVHKISGRHWHIALIYVGVSASDRVILHEREHRSFRWFRQEELGRRRWRLTRSIRFYCRQALEMAKHA